jgi:hypothetical protein
LCLKIFQSLRRDVFRSGLSDGIFFRPTITIWVNFGGPWNWKC